MSEKSPADYMTFIDADWVNHPKATKMSQLVFEKPQETHIKFSLKDAYFL